MKTYALIVGLVLLSGCAHQIRNSARAPSFKKPMEIRIAALPVYYNYNMEQKESDVTFAVSSEFMKGGWKMIDRSIVANVLEEQRFQSSGAVEKNAVQIGRMSGANLVTTGTYVPDGSNSRLYLRIVDVETGEIVATTSCYGPDSLGVCAAKELVRLIQGGK